MNGEDDKIPSDYGREEFEDGDSFDYLEGDSSDDLLNDSSGDLFDDSDDSDDSSNLKLKLNLREELLKTKAELAELKADIEARKSTSVRTIDSLTIEDKNYLEDLREENPDRWRREVNQLEKKFTEEAEKAIKDKKKVATANAMRKYILESLQEQFPKVVITDESLQHLPYGMVQKMQDGDMSYTDFLNKAVAFLGKTKTTARTEKILGQPNIGRAGSKSPRISATGISASSIII